jgi:hypothetical protein
MAHFWAHHRLHHRIPTPGRHRSPIGCYTGPEGTPSSGVIYLSGIYYTAVTYPTVVMSPPLSGPRAIVYTPIQ